MFTLIPRKQIRSVILKGNFILSWDPWCQIGHGTRSFNVKVIPGERKAVIGKEEIRIFHHPHDKPLLRRPTLIFVK